MSGSLHQIDYAFLQQCMHCGMCLPTCPTFDATRRERHGPRGRVALMRAVADRELEVTKGFAEEMSYCLGCLACQTACPAGVQYDVLLETARAEVERSGVLANPVRDFWRTLTMRILFMQPRLLRAIGSLLRFWQVSGLEKLVRRAGLTRLLPPDLLRLEPQTPRVAAEFSDGKIGEWERPLKGPFRGRVAMLTGCVQDLVFSQINRDTVDVLLANGFEVHTPRSQSCCGSLHAHNGETLLATALAKRMIASIAPENYDAIITNAGGCGSHLRHYGRLLADDPEFAGRARLWDTRVRDIHEWLVENDFRPPTAAPWEGEKTVTYHDSCHLAHGQKVVVQPRALLQKIPGVRYVELAESSWCCGSAGVYNITQPGQSEALLKRKTGNIAASGAEVVVQSNPGCHLQIKRGLCAAGVNVEVRQPVSLLAAAYRNEEPRIQTL